MRFKIFDRFIKDYQVDKYTVSLHDRIRDLEEKYLSLLVDVKRLEEENIETTNVLYELSNSLDAVDTRIDILTAEKWLKDDNV